MKPYGREKNLKGSESKRDYHPRNGEANWWEDIQNELTRSAMKQKWLEEAKNEADHYMCECKDCAPEIYDT
jgi:hypothetical protein